MIDFDNFKEKLMQNFLDRGTEEILVESKIKNINGEEQETIVITPKGEDAGIVLALQNIYQSFCREGTISGS